MSDKWTTAYYQLVTALAQARDAGIVEDEVLSAVDDVYHEEDTHYVPGLPKQPKP